MTKPERTGYGKKEKFKKWFVKLEYLRNQEWSANGFLTELRLKKEWSGFGKFEYISDPNSVLIPMNLLILF